MLRYRPLIVLLLGVACVGCVHTAQQVSAPKRHPSGGSLWKGARRTLCVEPHEYHYKKDHFKKRHRRIAKDAWQEICECNPHANYSADYADGFREGFADYLDYGGNGAPPPVPPRKYWNKEFQNPEGHAAIQDWFAGFRHGAAAARDQGIRHWNVMPSSLLPPARQFVFPAESMPPVAPPEAVPPPSRPTPIEPPLSLDDLRSSRRQRPAPTRLPTAPSAPNPVPAGKQRPTVSERDDVPTSKSASTRIGPGGVFPGIFAARSKANDKSSKTVTPRRVPALSATDGKSSESALPLSRMSPSPALSSDISDRIRRNNNSQAEGITAVRGGVSSKPAGTQEYKPVSNRKKTPTLLEMFARRPRVNQNKFGEILFPSQSNLPTLDRSVGCKTASRSTGPATLLPKDLFARCRSDHARRAERPPAPGNGQHAKQDAGRRGKSNSTKSGPLAAFPKLFTVSRKKPDERQAATNVVPSGPAAGHDKPGRSQSASKRKTSASAFPQIFFASHSRDEDRAKNRPLFPSRDIASPDEKAGTANKKSEIKSSPNRSGLESVFPQIFSAGQTVKPKRREFGAKWFGGGATSSRPKSVDKRPKPKSTGPAGLLAQIFSTGPAWGNKRSDGDEKPIVRIASDYKIESDQSNTNGGL
jgi:hypothetical protein